MTDVEEFLERELDAGSFPGAVALVGTADAVVQVAAVGRSVVDPEKLAATPATVYDLASLTKPLVCGAVAAASFPGLDLSSPPGRYLPEWKATRYDGITLESFLVHTSGFPAWYPVYSRGEGTAAYRRTLASIEAEARPGERVIYSDLNSSSSARCSRCTTRPPRRDVRGAGRRSRGIRARFLPGRSESVAATEGGTSRSAGWPRRWESRTPASGRDRLGRRARRKRLLAGGRAGMRLFGPRPTCGRSRGRGSIRRAGSSPGPPPGLGRPRPRLAGAARGGVGRRAMSAHAFGHTGSRARRSGSTRTPPHRDSADESRPSEVQPIDFNAVRRRFHEAVWH